MNGTHQCDFLNFCEPSRLNKGTVTGPEFQELQELYTFRKDLPGTAQFPRILKFQKLFGITGFQEYQERVAVFMYVSVVMLLIFTSVCVVGAVVVVVTVFGCVVVYYISFFLVVGSG